MEKYADAGVCTQAVGDILERLGIECSAAALPIRAELGQAVNDLLEDSANDLVLAGPVGHKGVHKPGGRHPAEEAVALDQERVRPVPSG